MRRTIFALCAAAVSLSTFAQKTILERLKGNPKIDSLVNEVRALGGSGSVSYYYDGKLHKTVSIHCSLMTEQDKKVYDAVRKTCLLLTDDARESYIWEYHRDGVDSVRYSIAIGDYQEGDTLSTYQNRREVFYHGVPEVLMFRYDSNGKKDENFGSRQGFGLFRYEYMPDSTYKKMNEVVPFDTKEYTKRLLAILKQKGIECRRFYTYHDSTYTFDESQQYGTDEFVMRENYTSPKQPKSETRGTVFTMHSKDLADSVRNQIVRMTWDFLEEHPHTGFSFNPYIGFKPTLLKSLFEHKELTRILHGYNIYLHSQGEEDFNIIVLENTGNLLLPAEWPILKSWKNGKVTYDKKKAKTMTPQQMEQYTNGRWTSTGKYTPIEESEENLKEKKK